MPRGAGSRAHPWTRRTTTQNKTQSVRPAPPTNTEDARRAPRGGLDSARPAKQPQQNCGGERSCHSSHPCSAPKRSCPMGQHPSRWRRRSLCRPLEPGGAPWWNFRQPRPLRRSNRWGTSARARTPARILTPPLSHVPAQGSQPCAPWRAGCPGDRPASSRPRRRRRPRPGLRRRSRHQNAQRLRGPSGLSGEVPALLSLAIRAPSPRMPAPRTMAHTEARRAGSLGTSAKSRAPSAESGLRTRPPARGHGNQTGHP